MPIASAQIDTTDIVPFQTAQINGGQIVSVEMTQIPNLLFRTGWTNHQIILQTKSPLN